MKKRKNLAVFFGGRSCEHDISIITAMQTLAHIDREKYKVYPIYITRTGEWCLAENLTLPDQFKDFKPRRSVHVKPAKPTLFASSFPYKKIAHLDCAIICCHGMNGEDGTLQGVLELSNIPYTSSGVVGSALTMDKVFMKQVFEVNNLPITPYFWLRKAEFEANAERVLGECLGSVELPVVVKPANLGSSIGIRRCEDAGALREALEVAFAYDDKAIVEEAVPHLVEVNCAVLGLGKEIEVGKLESPKSWEEILTFEDKYLRFGGAKFVDEVEIGVDEDIQGRIVEISKRAFERLDCAGVVRIDFLVNADTGEVFLNEINNVPGSLANYLFPGLSFSQLIDKLIEVGIKKHVQKRACKFTFESGVLDASACKLRK